MTPVLVAVRRLGAAVVVGGASGAASAGFLVALASVTDVREAHPWLLWLLPVAGPLFAAVHHRWGGRSPEGNLLTLRQIRRLDDGVPLRMAPFVLTGTLVTHLFGGSAGREGTALQMAAGLTDGVARKVGLDPDDRQALLIAALAAGFGSVFGVPWAGIVFAIEVSPASWRARLAALPGCAVAAFVGHATVLALGVEHSSFLTIHGIGWSGVGWAAVLAPAFGICAWVFIRITDAVRSVGRSLGRPELRLAVGGAVVVALTLASGTRQYNGLSLGLLERSIGANGVTVLVTGLGVWLVKLLFTSITVGSGYAGGEVTPLFVMGATLGAALANTVGAPVLLVGSVGMMATFGAAVNASFACTVMGVELFGRGAAIPLLIGCAIARLCSSGRSLYAHDEEHPVPDEARFV